MEDEWWDYYPIGDKRDPMLARVGSPALTPLQAHKRADAQRGGMWCIDDNSTDNQ